MDTFIIISVVVGLAILFFLDRKGPGHKSRKNRANPDL
jgi:hypothetical protein